jgi:hypothetical protein
VVVVVVVPTRRAFLPVPRSPSPTDRRVAFALAMLGENVCCRQYLQPEQNSPLQHVRLRHFREQGAGWT